MIEKRDRAGRTALHYAAVDGKLDELRKLIAQGADVDAQEEAGWTPLHFAADGGNLDITTTLIEAHASVNIVNCRGENSLFRAVLAGNIEQAHGVVELLLQNGADPNLEDMYGESPLSLVAGFHPDDPVRAFFDR